ncbi:MAG: dihydrodipicolinate synthase family protein, partial [Dehalococcoidia bacterium]
MAKKELRGVLALMTKYFPSDDDGALDEESFRNHLRWMLSKGVHAIGVGCGADFDYNDAERKRITEILVDEVNGRVPCWAGASAWDTETTIKRARDVERIGADGVFMTGPPLDRP